MKYKPSRFNYTHKCSDGSLMLYNSSTGTNSLSLISSENAESVRQILKEGADCIQSKCSDFLFERGFIVSSETDENRNLKMRAVEEVMNTTLSLTLLPTEQCNFRCSYCYETFKKGKMDTSTQNALVTFVRKNIHKYTGLSVSWFGGEPLEALDVIEYLSQEFQKICKMAKKSYSAGMTTNAYNLTLETYKKLYDLNVYNYQITLDGLQEEHDKQRFLADGQGTFSQIVNNLMDIKNNTRNFNASFAIRTNYSKSIFNKIEEYLDFYASTFNDDARFSLFIHMASDWGGERVDAFSDELLGGSQYKKILQAIQSKKIQYNLSNHHSRLNYQNCICYASRKNSIVIGSDGIVYKCTGDFEYEKNHVGNLKSNGDLEYNKNHDLWLGVINDVEEKCSKCFFSACCLSMLCPAVRIKGISSSGCSFEKDNLGLFLELFDKKLFSVL